MTDAAHTGPPPVLNDPFARLEGALAGTTRMRLRVVRNDLLTPAMQQVVLAAPELAGFGDRPGQDIMLMVDVDGARPVRRRYTIRAVDAAERLLTLGIVRHDSGPGERWVQAARPGDQIEGIGPRGKIFPSADAAWHLFAGDFSALPAFFAMAGSLPAEVPATVILEVPGPGDQQELAKAEARVIWVHRDGRPAGDPSALAGEARLVLALREAVAARGLAPDQVSPKAYWGLGKANAAHGEPARDG